MFLVHGDKFMKFMKRNDLLINFLLFLLLLLALMAAGSGPVHSYAF